MYAYTIREQRRKAHKSEEVTKILRQYPLSVSRHCIGIEGEYHNPVYTMEPIYYTSERQLPIYIQSPLHV